MIGFFKANIDILCGCNKYSIDERRKKYQETIELKFMKRFRLFIDLQKYNFGQNLKWFSFTLIGTGLSNKHTHTHRERERDQELKIGRVAIETTV